MNKAQKGGLCIPFLHILRVLQTFSLFKKSILAHSHFYNWVFTENVGKMHEFQYPNNFIFVFSFQERALISTLPAQQLNNNVQLKQIANRALKCL